MLDPINALLASSCSRKGIQDAAIEAIWLVPTSIKLMSSFGGNGKSPINLEMTLSFWKLPSLSISAFACAIYLLSSSSALK